MPGGKTRFQDNWLEKELDGVLLKEWCAKVDNPFSARCLLCSENFDVSNRGFSQVTSHHSGKKHGLKFQNRFKNKSIIESFHKPASCNKQQIENIGLSHELNIIKAETIWAMNVAKSNMSFKSCNETVDLFKDMFPDSKIASSMQLKEKKVSYVINHGIAKYFDEKVKEDIAHSDSPVSIAFDETTNIFVKRQLDFYIRFWSRDINSVCCRYLTSIFLGHATADILLKELLDSISEFNIPLEKILCLSMDGPNVNKSLLRKFDEIVREETGRETLKLGFCNLHVVNNAFKYLLSRLQFDFDEFATDLHSFFKASSARREDFKSLEEITSVTVEFLTRHVSNRWLTAGPVAERILQQWPNLKEYFLKFLPQQKTVEKQLSNSERFKRIRLCLKNDTVKCYLSFIAFTHKSFEKFSLCFQSESPKVHLLYSEMNDLLRSVMGQFIIDDVITGKSGSDLNTVDLESTNNWKPLKELELGTRTKNLISELGENDQKGFLFDVKSALIKTSNYLKLNLPFCEQRLKDLEVLTPRKSIQDETFNINDSLNKITRICNFLHFSEQLTDTVREEFKSLKFDHCLHQELNKVSHSRIDHYWRVIFDIEDKFGRKKYSNFAKLVKASLILPHGNADPERGFSINNALLSKEKSSFNDLTIKSLRIVKGAIKHHGGKISDVPITNSLLNYVKDSHKLYKEYLEKKKAEEAKIQKEKMQKEKEIKEKEDAKKRKADLETKMHEFDKNIQSLKKERETALSMIKEGSERMKTAITCNNKVEMSKAQCLINNGTEMLSKLDLELSTIESRKDNCIRKRIKFA